MIDHTLAEAIERAFGTKPTTSNCTTKTTCLVGFGWCPSCAAVVGNWVAWTCNWQEICEFI